MFRKEYNRGINKTLSFKKQLKKWKKQISVSLKFKNLRILQPMN